MRCRSFLISFLILFFAVACTGQGQEPKNKALQPTQNVKNPSKKTLETAVVKKKFQGYVADEILIKFKDGTDTQAVKTIQSELHLEVIKLVNKPNLYLMKIMNDAPVEQVVKQLEKYKEVKYSEPNYIRRIY